MTILIQAKLKSSDDQTNINKYRVAANITTNNLSMKHHSKIDDDDKLLPFYIVPKCIRNQHNELEIDRTIATSLD